MPFVSTKIAYKFEARAVDTSEHKTAHKRACACVYATHHNSICITSHRRPGEIPGWVDAGPKHRTDHALQPSASRCVVTVLPLCLNKNARTQTHRKTRSHHYRLWFVWAVVHSYVKNVKRHKRFPYSPFRLDSTRARAIAHVLLIFVRSNAHNMLGGKTGHMVTQAGQSDVAAFCPMCRCHAGARANALYQMKVPVFL